MKNRLAKRAEAVGGWRGSLVLAAVLLPAMLYAGVAWEDRNAVIRQAEQAISSTTAIFEENARNVFETHRLIAMQVNEHISGMSWAEIAASAAIHTYLAGIAHDFPQVQSLWLIDPSGGVRNSSVVFPMPGVTVTDRDYFAALRARDGGVFIGPLVAGKVVSQDIFNVALRRAGGGDSFDGAVVVSASPSYLTKFWENIVLGPSTAAFLIRADGAFLARLPNAGTALPRLGADSPLMRALAAGSAGSFRAVSTVDGQDRIYAYQNVIGFPIYVGYGLDMRTALAPWRRHLWYYGGFFLLGTLGLVALALIAARRARNEVAALTAAARYRGLIEAAPDPMIVVRLDGRISFVNSQALEAFGYDTSELIGQPIECLIGAQFSTRHVAHRSDYAAAPRQRTMGAGMPLFARRKDGTEFPVDVSLNPLEIDGEQVVMALVRDVTAQRKLEADIEASHMRLVASARLSALGTMAGGVAHEINNPLMIVHAVATDLADLAEEGTVEPAEILRSTRRIEHYADRIGRIVKSMLHLARDGTQDPLIDTAVAGIVAEALDMCRQRFRGHAVDLIVPAVDPDIAITCREVQIAQILVNLLQNALDAVMEQDGKRWVRLQTVQVGDVVTMSVIDSGPGIPAEIKARIMDPFFTTKAVGKGTGLGLSLSRQFAEDHGGSLKVGEVDGHTCVSVSLPAAHQGHVLCS